MFVDARGLPDGTRLDADVAIVGAGAAGIAIALELARTDLRVVLLESGGFRRDAATDRLNAGSVDDGVPYSPLEDCRSRFFGGSTNCWGSQCMPLRPEDFEPRRWIHGSGWPISYNDLEPYYRRAAKVLRLGPLDYDPDRWEERLTHPRARLLRFESGRIENEIIQFGPARRYGEHHRRTLDASANVRCLLHANLVGIETDENAAVVESLSVATLGGSRLRLIPRVAVLAMGGIENARMLLQPTPAAPGGLGNRYGLVGRYFMDHPLFRSGLFVGSRSAPPLDLYDAGFNYRNPAFAPEGVSAAAFFSLTPGVQEDEELLRTRMFLYTTFAGEGTPGTDALRRLSGRLPYPASRGRRTGHDLATFLGHAPRVTVGAAARRFGLGRLARRTQAWTVVEPEPSPSSRITLDTQRDALGVNRVRLHWHLTSRVERTRARAQRILAVELHEAGAGTLRIEDEAGPGDPYWCNHQIGTTRMATDERYGVVDPDCLVHGLRNLYVAGSSVFPTAGSDMPTYTVVALAIRLAESIRATFEPEPLRVELTRLLST